MALRPIRRLDFRGGQYRLNAWRMRRPDGSERLHVVESTLELWVGKNRVRAGETYRVTRDLTLTVVLPRALFARMTHILASLDELDELLKQSDGEPCGVAASS